MRPLGTDATGTASSTSRDALERLDGIVEPTDEGEGFRQPKRTNREGARRQPEVVGIAIAHHEATIDEKAFVVPHSAFEARILRVDDADGR